MHTHAHIITANDRLK